MFGEVKTESLSDSIQDYVKAIYGLERGGGVSTSRLAARLGVTPGAASGMVKRLAEQGLVEHEPYRGVTLTPAGARAALAVIRRHRLLETFLAEELGMGWERVHGEAEVLEHVLSEELESLIAAKLGDPSHDPHGDPIPSAELQLDEPETVSLWDLEEGQGGIFARISDAEPKMLSYLGELGIAPGAAIEVAERQPFGGPVLARVEGTVHPLGRALAEAMRIELRAPGAGAGAA